MTTHTGIVVGIDGSEPSRHALEWALREAHLRKTSLAVIHVWAPPVPISQIGARLNPIDPVIYEDDAKATLDDAMRFVSTLDAAMSVQVEARLVRGYASTILSDHSKDADLLVVGSRGRGGFTGLLLGSVSQRCVEDATRPVAVIRTSVRPDVTGDVVVGVDGSHGSWLALQWAFEEAGLRSTRLRVAHAWSEHAADNAADATKLLNGMVGSITARPSYHQPSSVELMPIEQRPARALIERSRDAALLVVGSRGRGGFAGLLLGSVSQQCVRHAECPVVVVPDDD